jgi:predicted transcriptional regulator
MSKPTGGAVVLSLHPRFAQLIYSGKKRAELRRTRPAKQISRVLIYETAPIRRITGWFRVGWIRTGSASSVWKKLGRWISISRQEFRRYLRGRSSATVYWIQSVVRFRSAKHLRTVAGRSSPPQSFYYIRSGRLRPRNRSPSALPVTRVG